MHKTDDERLADRARALVDHGLNGLKLLFVDLQPAAAPVCAQLTVQFQNTVAVEAMRQAVDDGVPVTEVFALSGGTRIRAGGAAGELHIEALAAGADAQSLVLTTSGIGDYSTYTLTLSFADAEGRSLIDPLFASLPFKFRPGCFNLNCAPPPEAPPAPADQPAIDYLARDFDSFKHLLINAMRERVPGWEPTSEADLDMVILDLLAADADELCDFQDRVLQEAYLGLARKRVSLARHARLMDYHIHQGNQAGTWLVAEVATDLGPLPAGTAVWAGPAWDAPGAVIFVTGADQDCLAALNELRLYTWGGVVTALEAGATEADLTVPTGTDAAALCSALQRADVRYLVLEEKLNPETGTPNGRDPRKRQLLRLLAGSESARLGHDPVQQADFVTVRWEAADALAGRYCFLTACPGQVPIEGVSAFHGNLVYATHGRPHRVLFRPPGSALAAADNRSLRRYDEAWWEPGPWGALATLPQGPLAYRDTPPGGTVAPQSTAAVSVDLSTWQERIDLIESEDDDPHLMVETDELGVSRLRFGRAPNGLSLDADAVVCCDYQVGRGREGNVGADSLTGFDPVATTGLLSLRNPFDVASGRDPEPREEIIRRAPQAYRYRQLRAVTPADYVARAEELPEVSHAYARFAWTGSWRTVQVAIDPAGGTELDEPTRERIAAHLDAVRLIGDDLEVRPARYVALDIMLRLCAHPDHWPEALESDLQRAFSTGYAAGGRPGFFHPDAWTFGQALHASQVIGRALEVPGVERVLSLDLRRWNTGTGPTTHTILVDPEELPAARVERIDVQPFEIIQVANDPSHPERGRVLFDIVGGRQ
jgi:hypothetical protein